MFSVILETMEVEGKIKLTTIWSGNFPQKKKKTNP
jgi:hypothetical protein